MHNDPARIRLMTDQVFQRPLFGVSKFGNNIVSWHQQFHFGLDPFPAS